MRGLVLLLLTTLLCLLSGIIMFGVVKFYFKTDFKNPKPFIQKTCKICTSPKELDLQDFDIILVSESKPHTVVYINYLDNKIENYTQVQLTYSLDGEGIKTALVPFEDLSWHQINSNKSNQEYSLAGAFIVNGKSIAFTIPSVLLNMTIRAQPTVGKYGGSLSSPSATLSVNGTNLTAYAGVTAGFFTTYTPVDAGDLKVTTDWMMVFDKDWNFTHLDKTEMITSTEYYYPHTFLARTDRDSNSVSYLTDAVISTPKSSTLDVIGLLGADTVFTERYVLKDSVSPYRGATLSLIEDTTGGIGFHLRLLN